MNGPERLYALTDAISALSQPQQMVAEMFGVMERLAGCDLGSPGPLVHTLEDIQGYETEMVKSISNVPTALSVWMVNRILNSEISLAQRTAYMDLLAGVTQHPAATAEVRRDAKGFIEYQIKRTEKPPASTR
jgi:hypothetical protein